MAKDKKDNKHHLTSETVRGFTDEEIGVEVKRLRGALHELRQQRVTGKIDDHSGFKKTKRSIARVLTERNRRHAEKASARTAKAKK